MIVCRSTTSTAFQRYHREIKVRPTDDGHVWGVHSTQRSKAIQLVGLDKVEGKTAVACPASFES